MGVIHFILNTGGHLKYGGFGGYNKVTQIKAMTDPFIKRGAIEINMQEYEVIK